MNKKAIFIFFLSFLLMFSISGLIADQRVDNIDIYIVLDKSLSMEEEIESVKKYVVDNIIDRIVITGDYFLIIPFYGKTDNSFNGFISSTTDINNLRKSVELLRADGRFTDIGNALNTLRTNIKSDDTKNRKYMLLITDGKQEAPLDSPFYSHDGSFNHEFLENTKEIQKQGWKIVVLGIGNESDAEKIAQELSAGYSVVSNNVNSKEIDEKIESFLGRLDLLSIKNNIIPGKKGNTTIDLEIKSTGYTSVKEVKVIEIKLITDNLENINLLSEPSIISIQPDQVTDISIPVIFPLTEEDYSAEIIFIFEGENAFTPAIQKITVEIKHGFSLYIYIIIIAVVLIIIIYYGLIIIQRKKMEDENTSNGGY